MLNKYMVEKKGFFVILLISFLTIWGYGAQRVIVPVQLSSLETNLLEMGLILSLFGIPRAAMNIFGGYLSDRFSKRNNLILSVLLFGVISPYFIGAGESGASVGIWRLFLGVGLSWGTTAMVSYIADITYTRFRGTAIGIQKMITWSGMALAGVIVPILLMQMSFYKLMTITSVLSIIALFFIFFFVKEVKIKEELSPTTKPVNRINQNHLSFMQKVVLAWNGCFIKMIEDGLITFFIPIYIMTQYDDLVTVGILVSVFTAVYVISQPLGGWLSDRIGAVKVILIGMCFNFIGLFTFLFSNQLPMIYMVLVVLGMGCGMVVTSGETEVSLKGDRKKRSRNLGYWRFYRDLGSTIGPIFVGICLYSSSYQVILVLMTVIAFLSLLSSSWLVKEEQNCLSCGWQQNGKTSI
ncbi:MFS family permease [Bacillus pakistanensis]|uniref:MFS family permease n=1 Tax=Rossellomorea pakistanensis TaxID=992288 RepID=A0ABS2NCY5_9BACI|nr:MFS transporter [Bacillus pakistanensis]MBM7585719.1 MFS family permease [Bacillus pakistanensis]